MEKIFDYGRYLITVLGTGFTWLFGAWDTAIMVLICFMIADYITGLVKALIFHFCKYKV